MATIKVNSLQLKALKDFIESKRLMLLENSNYKLDYIKFMFHPLTPNLVIIKMRTHGITAGQPFDDINYYFIDENGNEVFYRTNFSSIPAWFQFTSEMREFDIINGEAVLVN